MSYKCSTWGLSYFGIPDGYARVMCDGCGIVRPVLKSNGMPFAWFINNRRAPGWSGKKSDDGFGRIDKCPRCKDKP